MKKMLDSLIVKLVLGVLLGTFIGLYAGEKVIVLIATVKYLLGQIIFFVVPIIILGFITPAIARLKSNASKMLGAMILLAYLSSLGAAAFSMIAGYTLIPNLNISVASESLRTIPEIIFKLNIPPIMSVMSALVLAIFVGLATVRTGAKYVEKILYDLNNITLDIVNKIIIPILPFFITATFSTLAYEGIITKQLPIFLKVVVIILIGHFIWLALLYGIAGLVSGKNPMRVLKEYGPAYLTAVGTMSSAATLPVALKCAKSSDALDDEIAEFAIPLGSTIHLCGSVLTEVFFVMVVSKILYGSMPPLPTMILFIVLLGIFAVGAPGVPGGTVMASIGIVLSVLGFDATGVALVLTIFAIQDSFGTACNVTGDGALALILDGLFKKKSKREIA
ncbi:MAG: dicarboxylate/amino acid:cation symporter [Psychrilyobacter sp.]|uniref:dicarboxylate/amino acid:cation symporter n=1 Tax=Psychrilyobacter sp. TaxID=2586924 RepID=UPI003C75826F